MKIKLHDMSVEELNYLLQVAISSDEPQSNEMIEQIILELQERDIVQEATKDDVQNAYVRFLKYKGKRKWKEYSKSKFYLPRVAIASIIFSIFFATISVNASGISVFDAFTKWGQELFQSLTGNKEDEDKDRWISDEYDMFFLELENHDINISLPTWMPEGYELYNIETEEFEMSKFINAWYSRNEIDFFCIVVQEARENNNSSALEKSKEDLYEYERNDTIYYIMTNNMQLQAVWVDNGYEVNIHGDLSKEQLIRIIDSIYERVYE